METVGVLALSWPEHADDVPELLATDRELGAGDRPPLLWIPDRLTYLLGLAPESDEKCQTVVSKGWDGGDQHVGRGLGAGVGSGCGVA